MNNYRIYVLENDAGLVKIGITRNFEQRKRTLSGSNGGGHKIVRAYVSIETSLYSLEHMMHDCFAEYRKAGTEWFEGITFESVVECLIKLTSSDDFVRCNTVRAQFDRTRLNAVETETVPDIKNTEQQINTELEK